MDAHALVEVLYGKLTSLQLSDLEPLPNAAELYTAVKALVKTLTGILQGMERNDVEAGKLMQDVTKSAYELANLLNDLESEAQLARARLKHRRTYSASWLPVCFNPTLITCRSLHRRLENVTSEFRRLTPSAEQPGHSLAAATFGRDGDLRDLKKRLLSDDESIAVHCITGSPGVGKTTLARLAYDELEGEFDVRAWVNLVSENFDSHRVIQDLLGQLVVTSHTRGSSSGSGSISVSGSPEQQLQKYLSGKKFFFVLDHVAGPEIDSSTWRDFTATLASTAARGSRILMTMTTAATTGDIHAGGTAFELEGLKDEDDCWSLLASVAFSGRNRDEYSHLKSIGKEMVGKCNGQPRAIKVLGGILKGKMKKTEWKSAFDGIPLQLFMDYDDFTPTLKRCFAYCTVFPKEYKLRRETLIQFWISGDNLVQGHTAGTTTVETIAEKYFQNLHSKSILLVSNEDEGVSMEPTHVNLARLVRGQAYFQYNSDTSDPRENRPTSSSSAAAAAAVVDDSPDYIQHISCIYDISMKFEPLSRYVNLHTLLIVCSPGSIRAIYSDHVILDNLFTNFPELRTLSLSGLPMQTPPVSIRELAKMRLLDLSHTLIEKIPDSTTAPCNQLLVLKLNDCVSLTELPNVENQINLRHLDINGSNNIKAMPRGTGKLVNLRSLSKFIVSGADGSQIQELRDLVHLSGNLSISGLQNVVESRDAREANLASKTSLRELVLEWTAKFSEGRNKDVETDVLECLRACSNLEALDVVCYGGTAFPEWISLSRKLVRVALRNCRNCNSLPLLRQLQLPALRVLSVEGMDGVKIVGVEFCGDVAPFPSLETLEFKNMARWEEWSFGSVKIIPNLRSLRLERCPKLKALKAVMRKLEMLTINECQELTAFSLESLPELRELDIQHCSNLNDMPRSFPSLTKLRIWGCRNLSLPSNTDPAGEEFPRLLELDIQNCTSLRELPREFPLLEKLRITKCTKLSTISTCPKLADFVLEECDELALLNEVELGSLTSMVISHLPNFEYPHAQLLKCLLKLINLEISKCANLKALTDECGSQQALSSLQRLVIDGCPKLKQLPDDISSCFPSLTELIVVGCEGLECFPNTALPENLKRLVIGRCTTLESLPPTIFTTGLEFVEVYGCPSLLSLSDNSNKRPLTLRSLSVSDCASLTSLPAGLNRQNTSLTSLRIRDCRSV